MSEAQVVELQPPIFSIKANQEQISVTDLFIGMKTTPDTEFKLTSNNGYSAVVKSDQNGIIQLKNIPHGEYLFFELSTSKK